MKTWNDIAEKIERDDRNKRDIIHSANQLMINPKTGRLFFTTQGGARSERELDFTDWGAGQFYSRLGMPVKYFKDMSLAGHHDLVSQHANFHLKRQDTSWLIRTRENEDGGIIRGILSDKYSKFDNKDLSDIMGEILRGRDGEYTIASFHMDDGSTHVKLTFPKLTKTIGKVITGENDELQVGVHIVNSEIGRSSVKIFPMVYRLICKNGLMAWTNSDDILNQRHIHLTHQEMFARVSAHIGNALRVGAETIDRLAELSKIKVESPFETLDKIAEDNGFSQKLADSIKNSWMEEPDKSVYGIINALTRTARDLQPDDRLELELFAGRFMNRKVA